MKYIGAHVSIEGGVANAPLRAKEIGAQAFALFTGTPNRWKAKALKPAEADEFKERCAECGFTNAQILPHSNYLINLGSPDAEKLDLSLTSFMAELERCMLLGLDKINIHPGSHVNLCTPEECLDRIAESVNWALARSEGVTVVLENTAGQGSNMGHDFAHLAYIIDRVEDKSRIGVCVDTCHGFSAGYDFSTDEGYAALWNDFDNIIGRKYLKGMHLNDDLKPLGSRIDRHASIGKGTMGIDAFRRLMADPQLNGIPLILETPDPDLWPDEISLLYSWANP